MLQPRVRPNLPLENGWPWAKEEMRVGWLEGTIKDSVVDLMLACRFQFGRPHGSKTKNIYKEALIRVGEYKITIWATQIVHAVWMVVGWRQATGGGSVSCHSQLYRRLYLMRLWLAMRIMDVRLQAERWDIAAQCRWEGWECSAPRAAGCSKSNDVIGWAKESNNLVKQTVQEICPNIGAGYDRGCTALTRGMAGLLRWPFCNIIFPVKHKEFNTCWSEERKQRALW